jgi:lysophospholipase L1-like esterase
MQAVAFLDAPRDLTSLAVRSNEKRTLRDGRSRKRLCGTRYFFGFVLFLLSGTLGVGVSAQSQTVDPAATIAQLERELAAHVRLLSDWGGLTRYGSENADLGPPAPGVDRVVFLGDEITEMWGRGEAKFFPGKPFLNRGIGHQTTPQMLVRFRQDVISLKPKVVVIQGGSSDLAGYSGPATQGTISENFMSMTELAKANGIRVVLASVTPVCDCFKVLTDRRPPGRIIGINGWLKDYAAESGSVYLDYHSALVDGRAMRKEMTVDGLIPNDAGYKVMASLAEQAITQALGQK